MNYEDEIIGRLSAPVRNAIAALLMLFTDERPGWREVRKLCEIRGTPERPVAAAFGFLPHYNEGKPEKYGYMDMLAERGPAGVIDLDIEEFEVNAAFEYCLLRYPYAKWRWYVRGPTRRDFRSDLRYRPGRCPNRRTTNSPNLPTSPKPES